MLLCSTVYEGCSSFPAEKARNIGFLESDSLYQDFALTVFDEREHS